MQNVTTTTTVASTETTTENPSPSSSSGYSLTYTHSTENGTVVVANNDDSDSGIAKSRKKGDLEEPIEELPSLPDPPYHAEEAENATTRELSCTLSRSPDNLIAGNNINYLLKVLGI